nr:MAG TPA: hypothetical protein [Caudoviricetes sp.]
MKFNLTSKLPNLQKIKRHEQHPPSVARAFFIAILRMMKGNKPIEQLVPCLNL